MQNALRSDLLFHLLSDQSVERFEDEFIYFENVDEFTDDGARWRLRFRVAARGVGSLSFRRHLKKIVLVGRCRSEALFLTDTHLEIISKLLFLIDNGLWHAMLAFGSTLLNIGTHILLRKLHCILLRQILPVFNDIDVAF